MIWFSIIVYYFLKHPISFDCDSGPYSVQLIYLNMCDYEQWSKHWTCFPLLEKCDSKQQKLQSFCCWQIKKSDWKKERRNLSPTWDARALRTWYTASSWPFCITKAHLCNTLSCCKHMQKTSALNTNSQTQKKKRIFACMLACKNMH